MLHRKHILRELYLDETENRGGNQHKGDAANKDDRLQSNKVNKDNGPQSDEPKSSNEIKVSVSTSSKDTNVIDKNDKPN